MLYTPSRCDALKWMWQDNMSYILNEVLGALTVSQGLSSPVSVNFHLFYKPARDGILPKRSAGMRRILGPKNQS